MLLAVVFDIGGVLELTPSTGYRERWEKSLDLKPRELDERMYEVWRGGTVGTLTVEQVKVAFERELGMSRADVERFMADFWEDYLGSPNTELIDYFRELRGRVRTGSLVCERLGVEPKHAVFVDDHEPAVDGARTIGMRAVLFRDDAQVISELESLLAQPVPAVRSSRADRLP
jgi:hypothetical protein